MEEMNVLVLNMSTFPARAMHSYQFVDEKSEYKFECESESQLVPITKLMLNKLEKHEQGGLQKIVIMATEDTLKVSNSNEWGEDVSPCSFYLSEVGGKKVSAAELNQGWEGERKETELYVGEKKISVALVKIQKPVGMAFYQNVIQTIKGNGDVQVNLFMDMQGGDRNAITQANAIVSLLKNQGIKLCGRYAIDFDRTRKGKENIEDRYNPINRVDKEYRTYELLSAMEIFRRYGKGQALVEFLESNEDFGENTTRDAELTGVIEQISDAIRLCDMEAFEAALALMGSLKESFNPNAVSGSRQTLQEKRAEITEFDLVFKDIEDDYKDIIPEEGKSKIVNQVAWCRKKGLLQQALTIIESKMPKAIFGGLFSCELTDSVDVMKKPPHQGWQRKMAASGPVAESLLSVTSFTKKAIGKAWEADENFIVNQWEVLYYKKDANDADYYRRFYCLVSSQDSVAAGVEAVSNLMNDPYLQSFMPVYVTNKRAAGGPERVEIPYSIKAGIDQTKFNFFMFLHCFLKKQRNETNHGGHSDIRCSAKQIEALIDVYLKYADDFGLQ